MPSIKSTGMKNCSGGPTDMQSGNDYNDRCVTAMGGPLMSVGSGPAEYVEAKGLNGVTSDMGSAKLMSGAQTQPGGKQA